MPGEVARGHGGDAGTSLGRIPTISHTMRYWKNRDRAPNVTKRLVLFPKIVLNAGSLIPPSIRAWRRVVVRVFDMTGALNAVGVPMWVTGML